MLCLTHAEHWAVDFYMIIAVALHAMTLDETLEYQRREMRSTLEFRRAVEYEIGWNLNLHTPESENFFSGF